MKFDFPCSNDDLSKFTDKQAHGYTEDVLQAMEKSGVIPSSTAGLIRIALEMSKHLS